MGRMLETGIGFYCMPSTYMRPAPHAEIYREAAREAQCAEDLGFDLFWTGEHHHAYDGYCPSSLPAIAFLASQTKRIKFATGVYVLPHHGVERTAQSVAAVSAMAPGRLYLGVGTGNWGDEYAAQGLGLNDRGRLVEEGLKALVGGDDDRLGGTELWYGATAPVALRRAGRYSASLLMTPMNVESYKRDRDIWEAALVPRAGQKPRASAFFDIYVDDDGRRIEWMRRRLLEMWRNYALNWIDNPRDMGIDADRSDDLNEQQLLRDQLAMNVASGYLAGSAAEIIDRLGPLVEAGIDGLAFRVRFDGVGGSMIERCMEQLAVNVVPRLKAMAR